MSPSLPQLRGLFTGRDRSIKIFLAVTVIPMLLYMAFWTLFPLLWGFALAFFEYSPRRAGGPILGLGGANPYVGLAHFQAMLNFSSDAPKHVRQFHTALKVTIIFAMLVVPLNLSITLPLAVLIESIHQRLKPLFRTTFFLPVLAPAVGVAVMWGFIFHPQRGLLNAILGKLAGHLVAINWLGDPKLTVFGVPVALFAVIVAYIWQDMGYNLVIFIAALQSIPPNLKEAARIDGANAWQMFWKVTIPLLMPTILLASVLTMISAFQVFDIIQVMTDGGPRGQTQVLLLHIYNYAFRYQKMGWAAAVALIFFLLVLAISIIQSRFLRTQWEY